MSEQTHLLLLWSPCKSDLLSASQENKTDLLSAWNDQGISTISPSHGMLVQCRVTSLLPRFASASTHFYTGEERGHLTVRGLPREPIFIELAWGLYWENLSQSCKFISLLTSLPYHIYNRLWSWLGLKPEPLDLVFSALTHKICAFQIIFFGKITIVLESNHTQPKECDWIFQGGNSTA